MDLTGWEFRFNWGLTSLVPSKVEAKVYRKGNWYIMVHTDRSGSADNDRVIVGWSAQADRPIIKVAGPILEDMGR